MKANENTRRKIEKFEGHLQVFGLQISLALVKDIL
jgi:hypothetical protein